MPGVDNERVTHYAGDDCLPDGHRSDQNAPQPPADLEERCRLDPSELSHRGYGAGSTKRELADAATRKAVPIAYAAGYAAGLAAGAEAFVERVRADAKGSDEFPIGDFLTLARPILTQLKANAARRKP